MLEYKIQLLSTAILLLVLLIIFQLIKRAIKKFTLIKSIEINRRKIILNLTYLILYLILAIGLAIIWGVDLDQFMLFITSILAVLGVGFFAQWSILSNLTASVILFFNHPVRIGDRIKILDKDFNWVGEVKDITGFYLFMKTDDGENITIPNSLVMQKGIEILEGQKETFEEEI
ncbi:mechanosensitive ion channel domain-containing protein [Urechidicola croceus]|uniref:Mechanosensitive ion channel protein MscS n=1 Tax=Urechidicola croceus TaxID=1850246 RepID=A0A1D8P5G6_9FLAO|nr:mechanosensitive ion channel domain-containing protein [Urechidicola croceus]AOW19817.1 mechanosensitive ion channel protein MscS [Urechidicola croceus]